MKKLMALALGMALAFTTVSVIFAQGETTVKKESTSKKKGKKTTKKEGTTKKDTSR